MALVAIIAAILCTASAQQLETTELTAGKPSIVSLSPNKLYEFQLSDILPRVSYVIFQAHSQKVELDLSVTNDSDHEANKTGRNVGILTLMTSNLTSASWFLSTSSNTSTSVLIMASTYNGKVPFVGGCNMEFSLENDPNLLIKQENQYHMVDFAWANLPIVRDGIPANCENTEIQKGLSYKLYARYMYANNVKEKHYFKELEKVLTAKNIGHHAKKIKSFNSRDAATESLASFPRRGVIYVVVASYHEKNGNVTSATYVPSVTYTCTFGSDKRDSCEHAKRTSMPALILMMSIFGFFVCFFGHRFFSCSVFYFGFMAFGLISYILLARFTNLPSDGLIWLAAFLGVVGGCLWLLFWIMAGIPVLTVLLAGLVFGYLFASLLFTYTPLDRLAILQTTFNYGMSFACGVLIVPVFLLAFTHKLSIVSSAVVGAFWTTMGVCGFLDANLIYAYYHTIHKATIPEFMKVDIYMPLENQDVFLLLLWLSMAVIGTCFQVFRERGKPQFPPCPYSLYKQRSELVVPINDNQGQNGGYESFSERSPLLPSRSPPPERQPIVDPI